MILWSSLDSKKQSLDGSSFRIAPVERTMGRIPAGFDDDHAEIILTISVLLAMEQARARFKLIAVRFGLSVPSDSHKSCHLRYLRK